MPEIDSERYKVGKTQGAFRRDYRQSYFRSRREAIGITQADLAALAEVNVRALYYIERGIPDICYSEATKQRVEEALNRLEKRLAKMAERRRAFWTAWLKKTRPLVRRDVMAIVGEARP